MAKRESFGKEQSVSVLMQCPHGILSVITDKGPYGVPVNYVYDKERDCVYIHGAKKGKKIEAIKKDPRVSLTAVSYAQVIQERFTTHYDSVILYGNACVVEDEEERRHALELICEILCPEAEALVDETIKKYEKAVLILKITPNEITGKRNRDE